MGLVAKVNEIGVSVWLAYVFVVILCASYPPYADFSRMHHCLPKLIFSFR